jgi:SAM-dependent methyltransferase
MLIPSHPFYPKFYFLVSKLKGKKVLDIGTSQRFAKELAPFSDFFDEYYAAGFRPTLKINNSCDYDEDIRNLSFSNESFGGIICLEVLEHVFEFEKAIEEIYRILEKNGELILSVPFMTGYHGRDKEMDCRFISEDSSHKGYSDYFRYTHVALYKLLYKAGFLEIKIYPIDGPILARLETILPRGLARPFYRFAKFIDKPKLGKLTTRHFVHAIKK